MAKEGKIIHNTTARERRKMKSVVQAFALHMAQRVDKLKHIEPFENVTEENLLKYRKILVDTVKKGMLERKDLELEIGITSAIVWFLRLTKEEQDRITNLW